MTTLALTYTELTKRESSRSLPVSSLDSWYGLCSGRNPHFCPTVQGKRYAIVSSMRSSSKSHSAVSHRVMQG